MTEPPGWDVEVEVVDVEVVDDERPNQHTVRMELDVKGMKSVRLLGVELLALHDDMRVGASPFADRLGRIIERFAGPEEGGALT